MNGLDKRSKKPVKKSKKLDSDEDEEFSSRSKIEQIEPKRTRKS